MNVVSMSFIMTLILRHVPTGIEHGFIWIWKSYHLSKNGSESFMSDLTIIHSEI